MINMPYVVPVTWQESTVLVLALVMSLFVPGFLISLLCFDRQSMSWLVRLPVSVVLSIGIAIIFATIVLVLGQPLGLLLGLIIGFSIVATGVLVLLHGRRGTTGAMESQEGKGAAKAHPLLVIVFVLVTAFVLYRFALPINRMHWGADFWTYTSYLRKWTTWGDRPAVDPIVGTPRSRFRDFFGGWILVQALLSIVSKVDPIDLSAWWLPPILMCTAYLALYSLAKALFRNGNAAILAVLVQVISLGVETEMPERIQRIFFLRINEDKFLLAFVLLPIASLFMIRFLRFKRKGDLVCLLLLSLALPLTHPLGLVEVGLTFGSFACLHLLFNHRRETILRFAYVFLPLVFLLVIPLAQRRFNAKPYSVESEEAQNQYKLFHERRLLIIDQAHNRYMVHPKMLRFVYAIAALASTPLLLFFVKKDMGAQFLLGNTVGLLFLLFNPLLTPLLGRLITPWMLWRLVYLLPSSLTIGYLLEKGMRAAGSLWQKRCVRHSSRAVFLPLSLLLIATVILQRLDMFHWPAVIQEHPYPYEADLLLQARQFVQEPSIIMSDRPYKTLAPAFLENAFVPTNPKVQFRVVEKKDVRAFFEAATIDSAAWDILRKYNCTYLITNKPQTVTRFWVYPLILPLYSNDRYTLFKVAQVPSDHPLILGNTLFQAGKWDEALAAYEQIKDDVPLVAYLRRGELQAKQGLITQAQENLEKALSLAPDSPWAQLYAGDFYRLQGEPQVAALHLTNAYNLREGDPFFPFSVWTSLRKIAEKGPSLFTAIPETERQRWGVNVSTLEGDITDYDTDVLGIGWFVDWGIRSGLALQFNLEHAQTILTHGHAYPPDWQKVAEAIRRRRGEIWLVGMWPEWEVGGNRTPEEYAEIYHETYQFIKSHDLAAMVAPGGIMEPTPLRLQWLDAVLEAYRARYHERLPADAWHINNYVLREERGAWGAGIPAGIEANAGQLYEIADNANAALFREQVRAFRQWMADHGERGKPLLISGYGVQMPSEYLGDGDIKAGNIRIREYMRETFDFLETARDDEIGYPADENRLVQRWIWFSLNAPAYDPKTGVVSNGMLFTPRDAEGKSRLTTFGGAFVDYIASLDE